jgi:hypothetical protein
MGFNNQLAKLAYTESVKKALSGARPEYCLLLHKKLVSGALKGGLNANP